MANAALAMMFKFQGEKEKGEKEKKMWLSSIMDI